MPSPNLPPLRRSTFRLARVGHLTGAIAATLVVTTCVDSQLDGVAGDIERPDADAVVDVVPDVVADIVPDTPDVDITDTGFDTTFDGETVDAGCRSNEACADLLGPLSPCAIAVCDTTSGACGVRRRDNCCESQQDCPIPHTDCLEFTCPRPGEACVEVDLCPGCDDDQECSAVAPPCTDGRCEDGLCVFEVQADCCLDNGDCDDGDPCTEGVCDDRTCRQVQTGAPGCCTVTPTLNTSFSPPPLLTVPQRPGAITWQVIETSFTPTPPAALYLGNPDTMNLSGGRRRCNDRRPDHGRTGSGGHRRRGKVSPVPRPSQRR